MIFGTIAFKTFNAKYFKTVTTGKKDLTSRLLHPTVDETKPNEHYFELFTQQTTLHQEQKNTPHILPSLINIEHETKFSSLIEPTSFTIVSTLQEQQETALQEELNLTLSIETLQFESNNPIEDRLVYKQLESINAMSVSVFDGHGGNMLAEYASKKVHLLIDDFLSKNTKISSQSNSTEETINTIKEAIEYAYDQIEQEFYELMESQFKTGNKDIFKIGSCALTVVVYKDYIIVGNCGDSQGMIITGDNEGLCYFSTNEQLNTSNDNEVRRIQETFREKDTEVLTRSKTNNKIYIKGILQPTRTLGDYYLKKEKHFRRVSRETFHGPYISHKPEFNVFKVKKSFKYLIIASDGLWDFATKKEVKKVTEDFMKRQSEQHFPESQEQEEQELTEQDLNKTYISQQPLLSFHSNDSLPQMLQDFVLEKCAHRQKKTKKELMEMKPGERRDYCDDISIAVISFGQSGQ